MNTKVLLNNLIAKSTSAMTVAAIHSEYKSILHGTYTSTHDIHKYSKDSISLTCWRTDSDNIQQFYYTSVSTRRSYGWFIPFAEAAKSEAHLHNYIEMIYVLEGNLTVEINDITLRLSEGEMLLLNNGVRHLEYLLPEVCTVVCLGFDDKFFEEYFSSPNSCLMAQSMGRLINEKRHEYEYVVFTPGRNSRYSQDTFYSLLRESGIYYSGRKQIMTGYVERILDLMSREYRMHIAVNDKALLHRAMVSDISRYISVNYRNVTVSSIACIFGYSPDYINRVFKKIEGVTLSCYIQNTRLREAMLAITTSSASIESIIEDVGYHNHGFFYKKFYDLYGMTPNEARQNSIGKDEI